MVLEHHDSDPISALMDLFPKIGLQRNKFTHSSMSKEKQKEEKVKEKEKEKKTHFHTEKFRKYWTKAENRRMLLDEFAKKNNFDPLSVDCWNSISIQSILDFKVYNYCFY